jgi:hypothetical protein
MFGLRRLCKEADASFAPLPLADTATQTPRLTPAPSRGTSCSGQPYAALRAPAEAAENAPGHEPAASWHLEYAIDLVGIDHVGVSTDYSFDYLDVLDEIDRTPEELTSGRRDGRLPTSTPCSAATSAESPAALGRQLDRDPGHGHSLEPGRCSRPRAF